MLRHLFSALDLAAVLLLLVFLFALSVPAGEAAGRSSRRMQNTTQLRGIHQGLVVYSNSNKFYYPGLNSKGLDQGIDVENRYAILFKGEFITPDYAISPYEFDTTIHKHEGDEPVTAEYYSFAMLQVPPDGARRGEWKQTLNSQAVVMADRNTGTPTETYGIHNGRAVTSPTCGCTHNRTQPYLHAGHWVGDILWNDNHVEFMNIDALTTRYGEVPTEDDRLFTADSEDDALLVHSGN